MKNNRSMKRRGFTLVELLIVIVVIGVLSAMMMLSSTEAVSSAKASNIISNLRNLKTAALSLYTASLDKVATTEPTIGAVQRYLNSEGVNDDYSIAFHGVTNKNYDDAKWYVTCKVDDANVKTKLKARAGSVGLLAGGSTNKTDPGDNPAEYNNEAVVCMRVR